MRYPIARINAAASLLAAALFLASPLHARGERFDGFNIVATPGHPFGSASAGLSLRAARQTGATTLAIIPFFWQSAPSSSDLHGGSDMPDAQLREAIRQGHENGFTVLVKPHVWVPGSWAGAVEPTDWTVWFERYRMEILRVARIAAEEGADALSVGTELVKTSHRPEWRTVIADVRAVFPRLLVYVAHNMDEAETVPFWADLDMIGVSLYPPLGDDADRPGRLTLMRASADRLDALAARLGKPALVAEIGLRSAKQAAAKPWESAEERTAPADPELQADVLEDWLIVLDRPSVAGVLVWRWFTDPDAGGAADTDFTVQGKPATARLRCIWAKSCD